MVACSRMELCTCDLFLCLFYVVLFCRVMGFGKSIVSRIMSEVCLFVCIHLFEPEVLEFDWSELMIKFRSILFYSSPIKFTVHPIKQFIKYNIGNLDFVQFNNTYLESLAIHLI